MSSLLLNDLETGKVISRHLQDVFPIKLAGNFSNLFQDSISAKQDEIEEDFAGLPPSKVVLRGSELESTARRLGSSQLPDIQEEDLEADMDGQMDLGQNLETELDEQIDLKEVPSEKQSDSIKNRLRQRKKVNYTK